MVVTSKEYVDFENDNQIKFLSTVDWYGLTAANMELGRLYTQQYKGPFTWKQLGDPAVQIYSECSEMAINLTGIPPDDPRQNINETLKFEDPTDATKTVVFTYTATTPTVQQLYVSIDGGPVEMLYTKSAGVVVGWEPTAAATIANVNAWIAARPSVSCLINWLPDPATVPFFGDFELKVR